MFSRVFCALPLLAFGQDVQLSMVAVQASGSPCSQPDWSCITLNENASVPKPGSGQALVRVFGSSVNPVNVDMVEPICEGFRCSAGTIGTDMAGIVVAVGEDCDLVYGSEVWGIVQGAYAQYALATCSLTTLKPFSLSLVEAGTIPIVGGTSLQCLKEAGAPWTSKPTVVVTAGQGGTGFIGVQLAKALGAGTVITAATGDGIDFVKGLGADVVVDYHEQNIFDTLGNDTVDVVFDNLGFPGAADKALRTIRSGGTFLLLPGGDGGVLSNQTKSGVTQIYGRTQPAVKDLETLAQLFDRWELRPSVLETFHLDEVPQAFTRSLAGGVLGKIAVSVEMAPVIV